MTTLPENSAQVQARADLHTRIVETLSTYGADLHVARLAWVITNVAEHVTDLELSHGVRVSADGRNRDGLREACEGLVAVLVGDLAEGEQ